MRFEFVTDAENFTITVHREFAAGRRLVWDCHTKRELLDRWFAPRPLTTQTKHMEFREGGYWLYAMVTPDGQRFWNRLDYKTIRPIDSYTAKDGFCDEEGTVNPGVPGSDWKVTFVDADSRTMVTTLVQYASSESLQAAVDMGLEQGLASTLERLDDLLAELNAS